MVDIKVYCLENLPRGQAFVLGKFFYLVYFFLLLFISPPAGSAERWRKKFVIVKSDVPFGLASLSAKIDGDISSAKFGVRKDLK